MYRQEPEFYPGCRYPCRCWSEAACLNQRAPMLVKPNKIIYAFLGGAVSVADPAGWGKTLCPFRRRENPLMFSPWRSHKRPLGLGEEL